MVKRTDYEGQNIGESAQFLMTPNPGAFTKICGKVKGIWSSEALSLLPSSARRFQTPDGGIFGFFVFVLEQTVLSLGAEGEANDEVEPIRLSSLILHYRFNFAADTVQLSRSLQTLTTLVSTPSPSIEQQIGMSVLRLYISCSVPYAGPALLPNNAIALFLTASLPHLGS
jgi:hypothetical protein